MEETVTLTLARYQQLLEAEHLLECLEAEGVDNWDGYSYAHKRMEEEK